MYVQDYGCGKNKAVSIPCARLFSRAANNSRADGEFRIESAESALTTTSDNAYFAVFDKRGVPVMTDAKTAADGQGEERREAHDLVELGNVSEETKGTWAGDFYDGGVGRFNA